ncbi:Molecular chaperone IbpA, HSP20 family [Modicisalibacter ilicicola DSM 19980]|uniref:Molecular chaperone IbpA, HSP20 family n=1 Tax=Modicisalibacter ilicicola DSM 19980 TaxID=1121942 RepID=A0A1M5BDF7_9GAMM|nr:Hsp20/alpha crystallin family protein [Halomonas ilicicola]SHF40581.1 Molecular chaperone IbpA, HSP20 family [Halomonas ilicicola DSM 19980]
MNDIAKQQDTRDVSTSQEQKQKRALLPPVDIFEEDEALHVIADMPGVTRETLHIEVDQNVLSIEGDIQLAMPEGISASYAEIQGDRFARRFTLSQEIDTDAIRAQLTDGVLTLTLPKRETHRRRRIEVKAA